MEFKDIGDTISVAEYNALVYLLRKFKRLTTTLKIGSNDLTSDFGNYHFTSGFKSFGDNWIITDDVTVTSNDVLKNCYYSFIFTVIDVNLSGDINRRVVTVDSESTGDAGTLEVIIPEDLIAENEVILPDFNVEVIFDEHEYYTPLPDVQFDISVSKRIISSGESTVITGVLIQGGSPLEGNPVNLDVGGTVHQLTTDSQGKVTYTYTGTGNKGKVVVSAFNHSAWFYDGLVDVLSATFTGNSVSFGKNIVSNGDVLVDWGDGTTQTINNPTSNINHTYADGESSHTVILDGSITSLGRESFRRCNGLISVSIPDSVTSIGRLCFSGCIGLTSIVIPDSVTTIEEMGFAFSGLTSVTIPDSVTILEDYCFYNCSGLTSVTIPDSVTSLGGNCFRYCSRLIDYELYWESNIITYMLSKMPNNTNTFFYIPIGTKTAYANKGYPTNKLIERGYQLTVIGDKSIIQSSETSTITALLVNNEQPVSDETLSYTVKHGTTTIESGTITTDSTGTATISYTGSGVGEVTVSVSYGMLLQETYEVLDCMIVTANDSASINYIKSFSVMRATFDDEYLSLTVKPDVSNGNYCGLYWNTDSTTIYGHTLSEFLGKSFKIDFDIVVDENNLNHWQCVIYAYVNGSFSTLSRKDNLTSGEHSVNFTVPSNTERLWVRLQTDNKASEYTCKTKNWRIYPI